MSFTVYQVTPIFDVIGKYESRGDYTAVYGGIPEAQRPAALRAMTVAEVISWQRKVVNAGAKSSAAGKYQIIRKTLETCSARAGVAQTRKFDVNTQDELALDLLRARSMQAFLDGKIDADDMMLNLAKEWASLPVPRDMQGASRAIKAGQSYYAGDGLNKAHATIAEVGQALLVSRERYRAGAAPAQPKGQGFLSRLIQSFINLFKGA